MLKVTKLLNGNTGNQKKKKEKKTLTNTHTHTHTHKNPNKLMLIINKFSKVTRSIYKSVILLYMYIIIHAIYKNELHLQ